VAWRGVRARTVVNKKTGKGPLVVRYRESGGPAFKKKTGMGTFRGVAPHWNGSPSTKDTFKSRPASLAGILSAIEASGGELQKRRKQKDDRAHCSELARGAGTVSSAGQSKKPTGGRPFR